MGDRRGIVDGPVGRIAYRRLGSGRPLLLINGYAATADDWDPGFLAALAGSRTVICPDNRGTGDSELGGEPVTIEAMAADAEALLEAVEIDSAPVAGWSMGGFIAQELARRVPDRVEALVLLSTDPGGPHAIRCAPEIWARLTDCRGTPREQATRLIELMFPPGVAEAIDRDYGELVADARRRLSPEALDAQQAAMHAWYARDRDGTVATPILAIAGELDRVIPPANAGLLAGRNGRAESIDGGGHAFMAQEPARTAALIAEFLAR